MENKRSYLQRQSRVEPVAGDAKGTRRLRQFLYRGAERNDHLFRLDMVAYDLLRIARHVERVEPGAPASCHGALRTLRMTSCHPSLTLGTFMRLAFRCGDCFVPTPSLDPAHDRPREARIRKGS